MFIYLSPPWITFLTRSLLFIRSQILSSSLSNLLSFHSFSSSYLTSPPLPTFMLSLLVNRGVVASVLQLLGAFNSTSILGGDKTLTDRQDDDTTATPSCASSVLPHKGVEYASNLAQKARRRMNTAADPFHTDSICSLRSTLNPSDSLPQERNMTVEEQRVLQEDHDISLTVAEKQVVAIARRYAVLKEVCFLFAE